MSHKLLSKTSPPSNGPVSALIHILDEHCLLNVFSLCRPLILDEREASNKEILDGGQWDRERWWYTVVHVCRRWRYLVLQSASYLRLSLLCSRGTPVADMLANSPPLPLTIDHLDEYKDITTEDEEGIFLALRHYDRVRRIRLRNSIPKLQRLVLALDDEYPILEFMLIQHQSYLSPSNTNNTSLNFPETFQAPHLRHLVLMNFDLPISSPLLMTMGNLVTLSLNSIPPSAYSHPNALLQRISLMPQLEILRISFNTYLPSHDIERQLLRGPIMTHVALPNLRWFGFKGASTYLEGLLPRITFPLLEKLNVYFFNQLTYSIPCLQQFMSTAGNFRPISLTLSFYESYLGITGPNESLSIDFGGYHLDWQIASAAQIFHTLGTVFSAVKYLTLQYDRHFVSSAWNNEADRTQWRELLGSFSKVKTIVVDDELVGQLSHSLQPGEGESLMELLPELQGLSYHLTDASHDVFAKFIDSRQQAGHPVTVTHYCG